MLSQAADLNDDVKIQCMRKLHEAIDVIIHQRHRQHGGAVALSLSDVINASSVQRQRRQLGARDRNRSLTNVTQTPVVEASDVKFDLNLYREVIERDPELAELIH